MSEVVRPVKAEQPTTRAPFIDVKTGQLTPYGHRLLMALFQRTGGFEDDLADLLVPSLLGEVSALQMADDQARLERIIGDAVVVARASLAEELEGRIRALESPLNLPLSLAIARVSETAESLDALIRVLNGTTPFTGLNANGTDVITFLGRTDGSALDDVAGVTAGLITPSYVAFTSGSVSWTASAAEQSLQTVTVTVARGDVVINASATVIMDDPAMAAANFGTMKLYRDSVEIVNARVALGALGGGIGTYKYPPQYVLNWLDTPGAGTYDYEITFLPDMTLSGQINRRYLSALPLEG